jgi:uncharacterized membrane protein
MEQYIKIAVYIHALCGGIGLLCGFAIMIAKKGTKLHKRLGKWFSYGMFTSCLISLPICWLPNHQNIFLFLIGVFTIYLILSGNRAITFKSKTKLTPDKIDYTISTVMVLVSLVMLILGIVGFINKSNNSILFFFFGLTGFYISIKDFKFFKNYKTIKNLWLKNHIGKMMGAFIASVTAFIVAGLQIGNLLGWILPSIIGTFFIIFWNKKLRL